MVQNLGKYERQAWQVAEFAGGAANTRSLRSAEGSAHGTSGSGRDDSALREQRERETAYRKFILELYHATPVSGHVWLHGVKGGRMVHVAAVDAPVSALT